MSNDDRGKQLDDAIAKLRKQMDDTITQQHAQMMQSLPSQFNSAITQANVCTNNGDDIGAYMNIIRAQMIKSILDQKQP